jgi:hypothetical protein
MRRWINRAYFFSGCAHAKFEVIHAPDPRGRRETFIDIPIQDPFSEEVRAAQIFVAVLGASNYTYAEATFARNP